MIATCISAHPRPGTVSRRQRFLLAGSLFALLSLGALKAGTPPENDSFAARSVLQGPSPAVLAYNVFATIEPGEPIHAGQTTTRSLWWSWTAPTTGWANFSTFGSDGAPVTAVYVGDSLGNLSAVGATRDASYFPEYTDARTDSVSVPVKVGVTYQIAVALPQFSFWAISRPGRIILSINRPPTILSESAVETTPGASFSYAIRASNGPTRFGATNLPPGLSVNPFTGNITGSISSSGIFEVEVFADGPGGRGRATLSITSQPIPAETLAPEFSSGDAVVFGYVGASLRSSFWARNRPTGFFAEDLPPGLTATGSTVGMVTGTPTQAGTYKTTLRFENAAGSTRAVTVFHIREKPPLPLLQSAATAYGTVGKAFSYYLYSRSIENDDRPVAFVLGELPGGLSFDGRRSIGGIPTTAGTYEIPVTATNAVGDSTSATLTLVIAPAETSPPPPTASPVISSPAGAIGYADRRFSYSISATDQPTQFSATGLPAGLTLNPYTGQISGLATETGSFSVNLTAANSLGATTSQLSLVIAPPPPPLFTSPAAAIGVVGQSFSYSLSAEAQDRYSVYDFPTQQTVTLQVSDLPPGLTFSVSPTYGSSPFANGSISGKPTAAGTYHVPVSATFRGVTTNATLTIIVADKETSSPVITSQASVAGKVGVNLSYQINASNGASTFSAAGLPPGLAYDTASHTISGKPTTVGTFSAYVTAANALGRADARVTFVIAAAPTVTFYDDAATEGVVGESFSSSINVSNPLNDTVTYTAENLPPGLQFSATGAFSGTPTAAGTYPVQITATNGGGIARETRTFVIRATDKAPVITSDSTTRATVGKSFAYSLSADGNPTSYTFGTLPPGLSANGSTLSGTPTQAGTYDIPLTARNTVGAATGVLRLRVAALPPRPQFASAASTRAYIGQNVTFTFDAGSDAASYRLSGTLPIGVTFDAANRQLTGTPTQSGTFPLLVSATGPGGTTTAPFRLIVEAPLPPPVLTSPLVVSVPLFQSLSIPLSATNAPTAFTAAGLPTGVTYSSSTRRLTGSVRTSGTYPVTVSASNSTGSRRGIVTLTTDSLPTSGFGPAMVLASVGNPINYAFFSGNPYDFRMMNRSFTAKGLPDGVSINPLTGAITGVPTAVGPSLIKITATHSLYPSIVCTLTIETAATPDLPLLTSASDLRATVGVRFDQSLKATNNPRRFEVIGIPPGLTLDADTGSLTGTPTAAGSYPMVIIATNTAGSVSFGATITVENLLPPEITMDAGASVDLGTTFSFSPSAQNAPASFTATGLPPGLTMDASSGLISGRPTTTGRYAVTVEARNAAGADTAQVTIDVLTPRSPVISSDSVKQDVAVGESFSYTIYASNNPTAFTAGNLPPGLTLNATTGTITGKPTAAGNYTVPLTATNLGGTGVATALFQISPPRPALLTSAAGSRALLGESTRINLSTSPWDSAISSPKLPPGLTLEDGSLSGVPTQSGSFFIPIRVGSGISETTTFVSLRVEDTPSAPPVITTPLTITSSVGTTTTTTITATNLPLSLYADLLPDGFSFNPSTRTLVGTASEPGAPRVKFITVNAVGMTSAFVTLLAQPSAPSLISSPASVTGTAGQPFRQSLSIARPTNYYYFGYENETSLPLTLAARGLPPGLYLDAAAQTIAGTATTAGDFPVELIASTALGDKVTHLTLHIDAAKNPPSSSADLRVSPSTALTALGAVGSPFSFNAWPQGAATEIRATGLPPGLTLQTSPGVSNDVPTSYAKITGTPTTAGTYPVRITFQNSSSRALAVVTIHVPASPSPPDISGSLTTNGILGKPFYYYIDGSFSSYENNAATAFTATGLPAGLSVDATNQRITGTPTTAGIFTPEIRASNAGGTTRSTPLFIIAPFPGGPPQLAGPFGLSTSSSALPAGLLAHADATVRYPITSATAMTSITAQGLPAGLTLVAPETGPFTSATIVVQPTETGTFPVTITASNAAGTTTRLLTLDVLTLDAISPAPPPDPTPSPTPSPTPASRRPTLVFAYPDRLVIRQASRTMSGRILHFDPPSSLLVRVGQSGWEKIRVAKNGTFSLQLQRLPLGQTALLLRLVDSQGIVATRRVQIIRPGSGVTK